MFLIFSTPLLPPPALSTLFLRREKSSKSPFSFKMGLPFMKKVLGNLNFVFLNSAQKMGSHKQILRVMKDSPCVEKFFKVRIVFEIMEDVQILHLTEFKEPCGSRPPHCFYDSHSFQILKARNLMYR